MCFSEWKWKFISGVEHYYSKCSKGRLHSINEMNFNYLAAALGPFYMIPIILQQQRLKDRGVGGLHNKQQ